MLPVSPNLTAVDFSYATYLFAVGRCEQANHFSVFPMYWWARDRSWIVVLPSDTYDFLVGCDAVIASELMSEDIDVFEIGPWDDDILDLDIGTHIDVDPRDVPRSLLPSNRHGRRGPARKGRLHRS
jgi:hypothetical protein